MTQIILDANALAKLRPVRGEVKICDESGNVVGYFAPAVVEDNEDYKDIVVPFTEEELDRRSREPGGRSLAEILADLQSGS